MKVSKKNHQYLGEEVNVFQLPFKATELESRTTFYKKQRLFLSKEQLETATKNISLDILGGLGEDLVLTFAVSDIAEKSFAQDRISNNVLSLNVERKDGKPLRHTDFMDWSKVKKCVATTYDFNVRLKLHKGIRLVEMGTTTSSNYSRRSSTNWKPTTTLSLRLGFVEVQP